MTDATPVPATKSRKPKASPDMATPCGGELSIEALYLGQLAARLMHPGIHNMQPEHIEARCAEALAKAEVLLATLKARYNK